tara:strand:- start:319 stop:2793 length:2475 start_codon:yes stop_codon:yes gene_type:complete
MADFSAQKVEGGWQYTDNDTGLKSSVHGSENDARADLIKKKQMQKAKPKPKPKPKAEAKPEAEPKRWDWKGGGKNPYQGSDEVSDPLNVRSGGLLDRFTRRDTKPEINKAEQLRQIKEFWGGYKPGPGNEHYKGPIKNEEPQVAGPHSYLKSRPEIKTLEQQDEDFRARSPKKSQNQIALEQDRAQRLGEKEQITPEQAAEQVAQDQANRDVYRATPDHIETEEGELAAEQQRIAMDEKRKQDSLIDVFTQQAVPKLKDTKDNYNKDDFEADIAQAALETNNPKETKAKLREATGDYYIDPTTGYALDLRQLNKAIDRKQFMEEAALLPPDSRAQFLADKGVINQSDVKLSNKQKKEQKLLDLNLAKASLQIAKLKADDPNKKMHVELLKQAIASKNAALVGILGEGLDLKGVDGKSLDIAAIQKSFNAGTKKSLKDTGRGNIFKAETGLDPEKFLDRKSKIQEDLLDFGKPADEVSGKEATTGKRQAIYNDVGLATYQQYNSMPEAEKNNYLKSLGVGIKQKNPNIPMSEIQNHVSRFPMAGSDIDYKRWSSDFAVYLKMRKHYEGDSYGTVTSFLRDHTKKDRSADTVDNTGEGGGGGPLNVEPGGSESIDNSEETTTTPTAKIKVKPNQGGDSYAKALGFDNWAQVRKAYGITGLPPLGMELPPKGSDPDFKYVAPKKTGTGTGAGKIINEENTDKGEPPKSLIEEGFKNTRNRKAIEKELLDSTRPRFAKDLSDEEFLTEMEKRGKKSVQDAIDLEKSRVDNSNRASTGSYIDPATGRTYKTDTSVLEKPRFTTPKEYAVWLRKNPERLRKATKYYLSTL